MLANVAWTYLMHEYYARKLAVKIVNEQGQSMALSENDRAAGLPALEWRERGRNSSGGRGRCHCRRGKSRLSAQNGRLAHPRPRRPSGF